MILLEQSDLSLLREIRKDLETVKRLLQIDKPKIKEYYTSTEAKKLMDWSQSTLQRFMKDNPTSYVKIRGRVMVRKSALDALTEKGGTNA